MEYLGSCNKPWIKEAEFWRDTLESLMILKDVNGSDYSQNDKIDE